MKKIPTLFKRDPENLKTVLPEVNPGCEWVLAGEGHPTRKYDGTCTMFDGRMWWARREVKPGKQVPDDFRSEMTDETTGKAVGWVPMVRSPFARYHAEALANYVMWRPAAGTYELVGPKINGNPEHWAAHALVAHATAEGIELADLSFVGLREEMKVLRELSWEGIVWHHPDGRMAKLKVRDFPEEARDA